MSVRPLAMRARNKKKHLGVGTAKRSGNVGARCFPFSYVSLKGINESAARSSPV